MQYLFLLYVIPNIDLCIDLRAFLNYVKIIIMTLINNYVHSANLLLELLCEFWYSLQEKAW